MMCTAGVAALSVVLPVALESAGSVRAYVQRSGSPGQTVMLLMIVAAAAGLWVAIYWWDRQRRLAQQVAAGRSGALFEQLCRLHQLSPADCQLLQLAADEAQIAQPALLFVDGSVLRRFSRDSGSRSSAAASTDHYARLFQQLFEEPE